MLGCKNTMVKNKFITSFFIATIILTAFLFSLTQVNASVVFSDGYESGDFSAWDGTKTSDVNVLYHREYIRLSALPPSGAESELFGILDPLRTISLGTLHVANSSGD